jgi:hypothetical protein
MPRRCQLRGDRIRMRGRTLRRHRTRHRGAQHHDSPFTHELIPRPGGIQSQPEGEGKGTRDYCTAKLVPTLPDSRTFEILGLDQTQFRNSIANSSGSHSRRAQKREMEDLHPIVTKWISRYEQYRSKASASADPWVRERTAAPLSETDHRLHRILTQLLRALETRGAEVCENESGEIRVTIGGESIDFRIREIMRQERVFSDDRRRSDLTLVGTGKLVFEIRTYLRGRHKEEWREGKSNPLDSQLPKIVDRLFEGAQILRAWHREREEAEEGRRQAATQRAEKARVAKLEQRHRDKLIESAVDWQLASQLREFIAAIKSQPLERESEVRGKTVAEWLAWADSVADALDPLHNGAASLFNSVGDEG